MDLTGKPLRTLFIVPSLVRAGAETQLVSLVNGLDPKSFEKHLLVFERQLDQLERVDRNQVVFYHAPRRFKFDLKPALEIARLIDEREIEVVHCTLPIALFFGWLGARLSKRKPRLIVALHSTISRDRKVEFLDQVLYRWLMRACSKVICVCHAQESHWLVKFPFLKGKISVIYNAIDTDHFSRATTGDVGQKLRRELDIPSDAFIICCIAGFRPEKAHGVLVEAFERVVKKRADIFLLLAGEGPLRGSIERKIVASGINSRVRFVGNAADVRPILAASDCSILASTAVETFSLAMLESLAMKVPMIATDIGGVREAVQEGETGHIVKPGDAGQIADAIEKMMNDPKGTKIMGAKARALVETRFTMENMLDQTALILSDCSGAGC